MDPVIERAMQNIRHALNPGGFGVGDHAAAANVQMLQSLERALERIDERLTKLEKNK